MCVRMCAHMRNFLQANKSENIERRLIKYRWPVSLRVEVCVSVEDPVFTLELAKRPQPYFFFRVHQHLGARGPLG